MDPNLYPKLTEDCWTILQDDPYFIQTPQDLLYLKYDEARRRRFAKDSKENKIKYLEFVKIRNYLTSVSFAREVSDLQEFLLYYNIHPGETVKNLLVEIGCTNLDDFKILIPNEDYLEGGIREAFPNEFELKKYQIASKLLFEQSKSKISLKMYLKSIPDLASISG
jgi:hypothetical protein